MKIKFITLVILLFIPFYAAAQTRSYDLNGYVKYLFSTTDTPPVDRLNDHLLHVRINSRWYPTDSLIAVLELRFRGFYGDSVHDLPAFMEEIQQDYDHPKLDATLWDQQKSFGYGQIDRLYLDYMLNKLQVSIGRQRIAWGTSLVWNVIDLFNPLSVLDFDYEERPGTDAVRMQYYTGAVSKVEFAFKPDEDEYKRTFAGLWSTNLHNYDFFVIAALKNQRRVFGGAWTGDIKGAGFRGEVSISDPPNKGEATDHEVSPLLGRSLYADNAWVASVVLSFDYTFPNTFYIHTETMYNSNGKSEQAGEFALQAMDANMLSPARWSIFQEFAYDLTPLLRASIFGIYNPDDRSALLMPSFTWSVATNLDLLLTGYTTFGAASTEWGNQGNALFVRLKYAF
ncbi:hypothetical protein U27_02468 [Candidatus Vecturithrix granuli]|uniref:Alginate export domain-containing protein n=1 Tax=Vecturithrix granuli TaxID=1499967 RepID=A0A0S6WAR7_VECG1|nr:hypothetical protein U27_02468 [Candidatus Vecturithrix granuli]